MFMLLVIPLHFIMKLYFTVNKLHLHFPHSIKTPIPYLKTLEAIPITYT